MARFALLLPREEMVEPAGRIARELEMDAGEHDFFLVFHSKTHLLRVIFGSLGTMPHIGLSYHIQMALTILRRKI